MPELPEVEFGRTVAESVAVGRTIIATHVHADDIVFAGVPPARIRRALTGATVHAVCRRGKQIWMELDRRPWPIFHFGMTGSFRVPDGSHLRLASSPSEEETLDWPPRFTKIRFVFDNDAELAMVNKRRLGRILLRHDPASEPPISRLGFDPLLDLPGPAGFAARLGKRKGNIKGMLLDQSFAAGVGNWIVDEVLYQAKIDPNRTADTLTDQEVRRLRSKLKLVITRAVEVDADKERFPRTWLFHHRWGKTEGATTARGEGIVFSTIAGRTTAWVPSRQR